MDRIILSFMAVLCAVAFTAIIINVREYYTILFSVVAMVYLTSECVKYIKEVRYG